MTYLKYGDKCLLINFYFTFSGPIQITYQPELNQNKEVQNNNNDFHTFKNSEEDEGPDHNVGSPSFSIPSVPNTVRK